MGSSEVQFAEADVLQSIENGTAVRHLSLDLNAHWIRRCSPEALLAPWATGKVTGSERRLKHMPSCPKKGREDLARCTKLPIPWESLLQSKVSTLRRQGVLCFNA